MKTHLKTHLCASNMHKKWEPHERFRFHVALYKPNSLRKDRDSNPGSSVTRLPHFECGPIDHSGIFPIFRMEMVLLFSFERRKDRTKYRKFQIFRSKISKNSSFFGLLFSICFFDLAIIGGLDATFAVNLWYKLKNAPWASLLWGVIVLVWNSS